jgi:hypothetical protein
MLDWVVAPPLPPPHPCDRYLLMNAGQPTMGVAATFDGAPPDDDDPFWCPWNPATGQQFPRQVQMDFLCDNAVNGAVELLAIENSTEHCKCVGLVPFSLVLVVWAQSGGVGTSACVGVGVGEGVGVGVGVHVERDLSSHPHAHMTVDALAFCVRR